MPTAIAIAAAAAVISAAGAIQQGQAAKKEANFQAGLADQQAETARLAGQAQSDDYLQKQQAAFAHRRAMMANSGVETDTGSPLMVSQQMAGDSELQALRIQNNADVTANNLEGGADLDRLKGADAQTASYYRAGGDLLDGFSSYGSLKGKIGTK